MDYFPLFLRLAGKPVLVVGGGEVAARKLQLLLSANADVTLVSPTLADETRTLLQQHQSTWIEGVFDSSHLSGMRLVVAATDDLRVNETVAAAAESVGIWANIVDNTALSEAIVPAIVDRSPLMIAISSGATAPVLARRIRAQIEALIDESFGLFAQMAQAWRARVKSALPLIGSRRKFWDALLDSRALSLLKQGKAEAVHELFEQLLASHEHARGHVSLVGAGPGDPGLLTLNAQRALQQADVILHDQLVSPAILQMARRDASMISVGKKAGDHKTSQHEINALLIKLAKENKRVVRLKGGDPFVFGRGGEELEALAEHGISFDVVPGITAALACAAYAGIPLTHRDHAQSVRFATAHCQNSTDTLDWAGLAKEKQTLAFYMGVAQLETLRHQLITHGADKSLPFAIIENGSRMEQRVITGTLDELPASAIAHQVQSPALLILGRVTSLHHKLAWFNTSSTV